MEYSREVFTLLNSDGDGIKFPECVLEVQYLLHTIETPFDTHSSLAVDITIGPNKACYYQNNDYLLSIPGYIRDESSSSNADMVSAAGLRVWTLICFSKKQLRICSMQRESKHVLWNLPRWGLCGWPWCLVCAGTCFKMT